MNYYREAVTIAAGGLVVPNLDEYPDGFFSRYAGSFWSYLTTDEAGANKVEMTILAESYYCFTFEIS